MYKMRISESSTFTLGNLRGGGVLFLSRCLIFNPQTCLTGKRLSRPTIN